MVAPSSTSEAPPYRIKRKPPPTIDVAEKYPSPDQGDPFAPLWVLRNRTSSLLGQNPMVSQANPTVYPTQPSQDNDQSKPLSNATGTPTSGERRRTNSYLHPTTTGAAPEDTLPPRRASPSPVPRSGSPSPSPPRTSARQGNSAKPKAGHYRPHSQLMEDGVPTSDATGKHETGTRASAQKQRQQLADVSTVTAATVGTVPPTSREPRSTADRSKYGETRSHHRPSKAQKAPSTHAQHAHLPLQGQGHLRRSTMDGHNDGSGTETESDASAHATNGVVPPSIIGSKVKSKSKAKPDTHGHRMRTVSPSPLRHGGSTGGEPVGDTEMAGMMGQATQPRQLPTPDTTVTTSSSSSGASRFARFLVARKGSNEGSSGYVADGEKRRGLKAKHRGAGGGKVVISAPIANTFVHHQGSSDFGGPGRASSEDERGPMARRAPFPSRQTDSNAEMKPSGSSKVGLADFPSSMSISRRPSPLPPHMADASSVSMNATMANSFDASMSLGVLVERSFEMSEHGLDAPAPQEPPKPSSKSKAEKHHTEMSWAEVNEEDYDYFSRELAANSTMIYPGPLSSPPLPPVPTGRSSTPPPAHRSPQSTQQQQQTQRTSDSDLYPTPAPSPAPSLNGKEKTKDDELPKVVLVEPAQNATVTRTHLSQRRDEESNIHKPTPLKGQSKTTLLPTPPLTAHAHTTTFVRDGPTSTSTPPPPALPPKINKRRLSSTPGGHPPPAPSSQAGQTHLTVETAAATTALRAKTKDLHLQTNDLSLPSAHSIGNTSFVNVSISTPLAAREDQETRPREEEGAYVMPRRAPRPPPGGVVEEGTERKEDEKKDKARSRRKLESENVEKKMAGEENVADEVRGGATTGSRMEKGRRVDTTNETRRAKHGKSASTSAPGPSRTTRVGDREGHGNPTCSTSVSGPVHLLSALEAKDTPAIPPPQGFFTQSPQEVPTSPSRQYWHANTAAANACAAEYALPSAAQIAHAASLPVFTDDGGQVRFGSLFETRKTVVIFIRHFWCPLCQDYMSVVSEVVKPDMLVANLNVDEDEVLWTNKDRVEKVDFVIISNGAHGLISKYRQMFKLPFKIYTDPTLVLYNALGMGKDGSVKDQHNAQCHSDRPMTPVKEKRRFYSRKRGDSSSSAAAMGVGSASDREHCEGSSCSAGAGGTSKKGYVKHGLMSGIAMVVVRAIKVGMPVWEKGGDVGQLGGEFVFGPGLTCSYAHRMQTTKGHAPIQEVLQAAGVRVPASHAIPPSPPAHCHAVPHTEQQTGHKQSQSVDLTSPPREISMTTPSRKRRESMKVLHHSLGRSNGFSAADVIPSMAPSRTAALATIPAAIPAQAHNHAQKMARRDSRRHEGSVAIPVPVALPVMMSAEEEDQWMEERQKTYEKMQEKKNVRRVGALGRAPSKQGGQGASASVQLELRLNVAGYATSEVQRAERRGESHRSRGQHSARPLDEDKVVYKTDSRR